MKMREEAHQTVETVLQTNERGNGVAVAELHDTNALSGATESRYLFQFEADDLTFLRHGHGLLFLTCYHLRSNDVASFTCDVTCFYSRATATLYFVFINRSFLAITFFAHDYKFSSFFKRLGYIVRAYDFIAFAELHHSYTSGLATHLSYLGFGKPDRLTFSSYHCARITFINLGNRNQLITRSQLDSDDAACTHIVETRS